VALILVTHLLCWPLNLVFKTQGPLGVLPVGSTNVLDWLLFKHLFNFGFMSGTPFYSADLVLQGTFMAWHLVLASIATVVPILGLVLLDFWQLSSGGKGGAHPY
jgi:hypothetical protein